MIDWFVHGFETDRYAQELSDAIKTTGNSISLVKLPPFSAQLPPISPSKPFVLYGGTRIIEKAAITPEWNRGVWYDSEKFRWDRNFWEWDEKVLMQNWHLTTFDDLEKLLYSKHDSVFVRPNSDLKEFAGEIMTVDSLLKWRDGLVTINDEPGVTMNSHTEIIVGDVMGIAREWRIFVVDGVPVECSRYRSFGTFDPVREFPSEVKTFVQTVCDTYLPAPVVVIDVGVESDGRYGVIEANCFNSSGWYDADITTVVAAVSDYVRSMNDN